MNSERSRSLKLSNALAAVVLIIAIPIAGVLLFFWRDLSWFYYIQTGSTDYKAGKMNSARQMFKQADSLASGFSNKDGRVLLSLNSLASVEMAEGHYPEAEKAIKTSLEKAVTIFGQDSLAYANVLGINAGFYRRQGKYDLAMPIYERQIAILENVDTRFQQLPEVLTAVAKLQLFLGHVKESQSLYQRAYELVQKHFGGKSQLLVSILSGFGLVQEWNGNYLSAEREYRKALALCHEPVERGGILMNLAALELAESKYDETIATANDALSCFKEAHGLKLLMAADSSGIACIASSLLEKNDLPGAQKMIEKAIAIDTQRLGPDHPGTARDLCIQAKLKSKQGFGKSAIETQQRAIQIYEKAFGRHHRWVAQATGGLAAIYLEQKNLALSEKTFNEAFSLENAIFTSAHPDYAKMLADYGKLLLATGKTAQAENMKNKAAHIIAEAEQRYRNDDER